MTDIRALAAKRILEERQLALADLRWKERAERAEEDLAEAIFLLKEIATVEIPDSGAGSAWPNFAQRLQKLARAWLELQEERS